MTPSRTGSMGAKIQRQISFSMCFLLVAFLSLFSHRYTASQDQLPLANQLVGGEFSHVVQKGDSLTGVGARFGIGAGYLAAINDLSASRVLKIGQQLRIDNRHIVPATINDGIVINIPQRMLFHFKEASLRRAFPVGLGRYDWPTPTGRFKIVVKEENPTWDVPKSIQEEMQREGKAVKTCVPPGPDNPLGKHWLGLSIGGYGIHGTIAPSSIYQFQTHGCIRAHPDDVAELFEEVSRGTPVIIVYRRLMLADIDGKIYLEVHRDIYKKEPDVYAQFDHLLRALNLESKVDRMLAADIIREQGGIVREIGRKILNENK